MQAIEVHGLFGGAWLGLKRVVKCQPLHPGGEDPVPARRAHVGKTSVDRF